MARPSGRDIRREVIDEATDAIRTYGVDGFSYGDLAERLGIRAPSIHHHFGRKDDLIAETTAAYRRAFRADVDRIAVDQPIERLRAYAELFLRAAADGVLCLCGAVTAGWDQVAEPARAEVAGFFDDELRWVEQEVRTGQSTGALSASIDPRSAAVLVVSALEGALLLARTGLPHDELMQAVDGLLDTVLAAPGPSHRAAG